MHGRSEITRRGFLADSTRAAAALGIGATLARRASAQSRKIGANDTIRIGLIGAGGRGTGGAHISCNAPNVQCVALCDVAEFRLNEAKDRLAKTMSNKGHKDVRIDAYGDYRQILERKDIDAVLIATPDHWHYDPFIASLEAGKHIYQEKPMCFTIEQGLKMVTAANKHPELTVQIGTQRRSGAQYPAARKLIEEGVVGDITYARAYDCRNFVMGSDPFAPRDVSGRIDWNRFQEPCTHKVEYDPWRYFAWRWYWDYAGGLVTDVGVHVIDVVHWLTGDDTPKSAVCNGGVYGMDYWETPDVVNAVWEYGSYTLSFVSNFTNGWEGDGLTLFGTKGTVEVRGHEIYIWDDLTPGNRGQGEKPLHHLPADHIEHHHNWIDCIRTGKTPNAPVELGFSSLLPSLLANKSYRQGTKLKWDANAKRVA